MAAGFLGDFGLDEADGLLLSATATQVVAHRPHAIAKDTITHRICMIAAPQIDRCILYGGRLADSGHVPVLQPMNR